MRFERISDKGVWRSGVQHLKRNDAVLARLIGERGYMKITLRKNYYEALVHAIVYQQISGAAGDSILRKFRSLYNGRLPRPKRFLATRESRIRGAGISPQKYSYIKDLCERLEGGRLEMRKFHEMQDADVMEELDEVRGIGRWTAEMFLMFSLGRTNVLPVDDLGIKKAVQKHYRMKKLPEKDDFERISRKWAPYKTIASIYLWRGGDKKGW